MDCREVAKAATGMGVDGEDEAASRARRAALVRCTCIASLAC